MASFKEKYGKNRLQDMEVPDLLGTYRPGVFQGVSFEPKEADISILQHSLDKLDNEYKQVMQQKGIISDALGKYEVQLHDDPTTKQWFSDYKDRIYNNIANKVGTGSFDEALRVAMNEANAMQTDSELLGKIKVNKQYQTYVDGIKNKINQGKLSHNEGDYVLHNAVYKEKAITNENKKIIGYEDYEEPTYYESLDFAQIWKTAENLRNSSTKSTSRESSKSGDTDHGTYSKSSGSSHSKTQITAAEFKSTFDKLIKNNPDFLPALAQSYKADVYRRQKLEREIAWTLDPNEKASKQAELNNLNFLLKDDNSKDNYESYLNKKLYTLGFAEDLSFCNTSDSSSSSSSSHKNQEGNAGSNRSGVQQIVIGNTPQQGSFLTGPNVQGGNFVQIPGVQGAAEGITITLQGQ